MGSGLVAGPLMTAAPSAASYMLPWLGQVSSVPPLASTVVPWCVQVAENADVLTLGGLGHDEALVAQLHHDGRADGYVGGGDRATATATVGRVVRPRPAVASRRARREHAGNEGDTPEGQ